MGLLNDIISFVVIYLPGRFGNKFRYLYFKRQCAYLGRGAVIHHGVYFTQPQNVYIGCGSELYANCHIQSEGGRFKMGSKSHLAVGCYVNAVRSEVTIGDKVAIGPKCQLIAYSNDIQPGRLIIESHKQGDIKIGDDVFLGASVIVLPGVSIGDGAVAGAGAVVTKDIPRYAVAVGVPARVMRKRE